MKKNYNYNYENRSQGQKLSVGYSNLGVSSCTSKVLKKSPVVNGSLWHTTDTNEFYYDWNGKRTKLNLTGDSAAVSAEIAKIKADVAKLDPAAIESKINAATSKAQSAVSRAEAAVASVNGIKAEVNEAKEQADAAAQAAQAVVTDVQAAVDTANAAAAQVENKVDRSELESDYAKKTDLPSVEGLASQTWVSQQGYLTEHQDLSAYATKSEIPDVSGFATKSEIPSVDGLASESWVEGKGYLTSHQDISGKADKSELPSKVSDLTNDAGFITVNDLPDVTEGVFPVVDPDAATDPTDAASDGLATVQDVMDYVNALFEKKKDELGPVEPGTPYLYTNGYKLGDTPIELTDPLNRYEIVLNENGEFEIELLHKNEEDGWFDIDDPSGNYYGTYFKIILPNDYDVKVYLWDDMNNDYNSGEAKIADPGYSLIAKDVTPDNTTYYYKDAVEGFLFSGAKSTIEATISQTYNNHLLKLVITKKNN